MADLSHLIAQREALEKQILEIQTGQRAGAISQIRELMSAYGLTPADIEGASAQKAKKVKTGEKVAAKYRNPETGDAWSGRGLQPKWLKAALEAGKQVTDFAV